MTRETTLSYESLRLFVSMMFEYLVDLRGLDPEDHPMALLAVQEQRGRSVATRSLTTAISELFVMLKISKKACGEELDLLLAEAGAPSVALVGAWLSKKNRKVLKRGHIETDGEFEKISALRDDPALGEGERETLQLMLDQYEFGK